MYGSDSQTSLDINGSIEKTESDEEDERYDECHIDAEKRMSDILSSQDNYVNLDCYFCLQRVQFKVDGIKKNYPPISNETLANIKKIVQETKNDDIFDTTGCMQIAHMFNEKVVKILNNRLNKRYERVYDEITAQEVKNHFNVCIKSVENEIKNTIDEISYISHDMYENGGMVLESKKKESKKTGKMKRKYNSDKMKDWDMLLKTKLQYIRTLHDIRKQSQSTRDLQN